ncbi:helix-turn-helix domain-containing protein [Paucibacter sp. DJ2R-2]|uniref:helix-turn-helix domain-containing protein n=1 Tax=Paucibacter sp. DJ2R-2 TaxID=2893558 RepID=UPI0021E485CB|nr:AraC family transcriptional regulator [Paucibacter sp. DJ2R-2]MCV2418995.1 AraC family transcriptional regulator [Paucibacter sp. DJ4R-1]MCV2438050.1 AraC family transcriptional regulator [Paucibacter sp. DJ2R-2]
MSTEPAPPSPAAGAAPPPQVFAVLSQSRAQLERQADLGGALRLAQWRNCEDHTGYNRPGHHTLSVYLQGGQDVRVVGERSPLDAAHGQPGTFCILPADHESQWQIAGPLRFVHLYLSDSAWAQRIVRLLDAEPRAYTLAPRIFGQDPALADWARLVSGLDWGDTQQRLQAHQLSEAALDRLVLMAAQPHARERALQLAKGGLAPAARRRVLEQIEAQLAAGQTEGLSLAELAAEANLSEFHFARMFRHSLGCSVHGWISQRRSAHAQALLRERSELSLAEVAAQCGYASASHLSRSFRAELGATPGAWRRAGV